MVRVEPLIARKNLVPVTQAFRSVEAVAASNPARQTTGTVLQRLAGGTLFFPDSVSAVFAGLESAKYPRR
jgi:hypothetical protein